MRMLVAVLMGLISGVLIYMMVAMLSIDATTGAPPAVALVIVSLVGGWAVSSWLLVRKAGTTSTVFRRGFLLGAAEWLAMGLVTVIFSSKAVGSSLVQNGGSDAAAAGAAVGGGILAALGGGLSIVMAVVCLIGFAIAFFIGREMHDQTSLPTRKCPDCAEMVQAEAKKCRYCGASLVAGTTELGATV